ncbi:MAG TPA: response regulator [Opitutaceae bacterium]|nr:response regulator [Opitutaceae bacterium]
MTPLILAVDDEYDVTDLVRLHCRHAGYDVMTAASGREAIETINQRRPDLILLDLMLPDIDGFSVCEILRRNAATATIPIVVLTAWVTTDSRNVGLELGVLDYITKPFSPKDLVDRVSRLLRLRPASA